jgi:hypothetical protein
LTHEIVTVELGRTLLLPDDIAAWLFMVRAIPGIKVFAVGDSEPATHFRLRTENGRFSKMLTSAMTLDDVQSATARFIPRLA